MTTSSADEQQVPQGLYRLVVAGELAPERAGWFSAIHLETRDGNTVMTLVAADQAELHALLRRVRDVNLRIIELRQIGPREAGSTRVSSS
jgi:hypothetical protein